MGKGDVVVDAIQHGRLRWFIVAFVTAGMVTMAMLGWQLYETTPARWCVMAAQGSPELAGSCVAILLKLLEIKSTVVIGLLAIVGLSVLSLAAVALGVRLGLSGPGGLSADIGADKTTVSNGESSVTLPTPPADRIEP